MGGQSYMEGFCLIPTKFYYYKLAKHRYLVYALETATQMMGRVLHMTSNVRNQVETKLMRGRLVRKGQKL